MIINEVLSERLNKKPFQTFDQELLNVNGLIDNDLYHKYLKIITSFNADFFFIGKPVNRICFYDINPGF